MAAALAREYEQAIRARAVRAEEAPAELQALDARIARLRERLQKGDPDITADEIQAALDRAEAKRRELASATRKPGAGRECWSHYRVRRSCIAAR